MKKILYIKLLALVLLLSTPFSVLSQDNEPDIKEQADKFFNKENYVEATPLYLRLIALNPKSYEYNYKYGTCILYNSHKKTDAFKYLNFAVTGPDVSPDAFYYLGKAFHLNYQFNDAVKNYELYKQKVGSNIKAEFEVDRHIQMCQNGKGLLTSISDIVVLEKKEYNSKNFFDLYKLDNIGGVIILTTDYQSKADKKRNHVPIIHFPNNPDRIYYSSYGDDKSNKDIYVRTKLPNGEWSLAQTLNGGVNTNFDEDFPYMSPDGRFLYFSSKGHNSMGGYDIFRSQYDPETNSFGTPENMDFAISSADNDLFYVVDSLEQNAYFASSRQSLNGNYYVYKVKVDRVPSQLAIVKGAFSSTVNPGNKKVSIKVTDLASGTKIGDFKSNEKGNYLITFPKGGKYEYEMKVEGSENIYKYTANIPYLKEFKPLKQKIFEEKQDAGSLVRVVDLFNEEVEDPQGVIVEVIRAKSELNVNANQFNLDELEAQKNNKKVLANLGLENASNAEIQTKFDGIEQKKEEQAHQVTQLHNGAIEQAVRNTEEIAQNQKEIKTLVAQANNAETDANKLAILKQAEEKIETIESLTNQNIQLKKLADSLAPLISKENAELKRISDVNKAVQEALQKNDMTALQTSIEKEAELLNKVSNTKVEDPTDVIENKKALVNEEKNKLLTKQKEYETTARTLTAEITQLETSLTTAKSKEKPLIQQKIDGKKAEKDLLDQEIKKLDGKIADKTKEADRLNDEIVFLESITSVSLDPVRNSNEIKAAMDKVDDPNSRSLQNYVKEEVKKIAAKVENNPDPKELISSVQTNLDNEETKYNEAQEAAKNDANLSEEDKLNASISNAQEFLNSTQAEKKKISTALTKNPDNSALKEQAALIETKETELKNTIASNQKELDKLKNPTSNNSTSSVDKTELINSIYPDYKTEEAKLPEDPKAKLTAQNSLDENLIAKLDKEEKALEKKAKSNPNDEQTKAKLAAVKELKEEKKAVIDERKAEIAQLTNAGSNGSNGSNGSDPNNTTSTTSVDKTELVNSIYPDYKSEEAKLPEDPKAKMTAQNSLDENLIAKLDKEEKALEKKAKSNPNDEQTKAKLAAVKELKEEKKAVIDERKAEIAQLSNAGSNGTNVTNGTDPTNSVKEIDPVVLSHEIYPEYQEVNFDNQSKWSDKEKKDLLLEEEKLRSKLIAEKKANDKKLEKKNDPTLESENRAIQQLIDQSERNTERINSNEANVAVENAINEDLKERTQELMYGKTTSESDATQKIKELEDYERNLLNSIDNLKEDEVNNNATIQIREEQLKKVRHRIGQIEMDLEELKKLNASSPEVQKAIIEANELKEKETALESKLATASPSEKKKIEKELSQNRETQEKKQVEIEKGQVASLTLENDKDLSDLKSDADLTNIAQHAVERSKETDENVLTSSTHAKNLIQSIEQYTSGQEVFNSTETVIHTEDALVQQQRSFSIEIGEIEQEINSLGTSKKDLAKKKELESQKAIIEKANNTVLEQLKELRKDKQPIVDNTNELNTQVSFEEEQAIAANEKYTQALELNQKVKETEVEIISKNKEIDEKKKELEQTTDETKRQELIQDLVKLTADKKSLENKLNSTNKELNDLILSESSTPMKWRNVLMREVAPAAVLVVSSFVEPSVVKGFELNSKTNPKAKTAIPVDLKAPGGLVYRVQVGAFAKPLRKELFTEFSLVTGEKLANGITRYLAGYFGSRSKVVEAQSQIKSLGYKDAFVVAYCDGKRITLAEAKRLEELGLCVPKDQNSIAFDVANSMIAKLPKDSLKRIAPTRKFDDYNKAPGAAQAEAVENRKGLFYTVQIGVYNSPVTSEKVRNIQPLITKRLENGQIRYSSGVFTSVEEAQPKKAEAIERGIKDAFITAYYNGERISLAEAERILIEKGKVVSETENLTKTTSLEVTEAKKYTEENPIVTTEKKTYQLISKETYAEYPRDLINRYNNAGSFYYDFSDNRIKSVVYTNEYRVPTNEMFENKMDTIIRIQGVDVYEPNTKKVVAEWGTFELPGELGNQLLHLSLPYSVDLTDLGCVIVFESVHEFKVDALVEELKKMSARTVEVKEMF